MKASIAFLVLALIGQPVFGDPESNVHAAAHVGTAFTLQTVFYGANTRWLSMNKRDAEILAFAETMLIGLAYKQNEGMPGGTGTSMTENAIGGVLAIGVHVTFEF